VHHGRGVKTSDADLSKIDERYARLVTCQLFRSASQPQERPGLHVILKAMNRLPQYYQLQVTALSATSAVLDNNMKNLDHMGRADAV
jgi:hypothetical protein